LPLGTTEQVEETAGFTAPVMFQLPSLEMTIPLVDTFLALSVQIPFSYVPVEKWYVFQAFVVASGHNSIFYLEKVASLHLQLLWSGNTPYTTMDACSYRIHKVTSFYHPVCD